MLRKVAPEPKKTYLPVMPQSSDPTFDICKNQCAGASDEIVYLCLRYKRFSTTTIPFQGACFLYDASVDSTITSYGRVFVTVGLPIKRFRQMRLTAILNNLEFEPRVSLETEEICYVTTMVAEHGVGDKLVNLLRHHKKDVLAYVEINVALATCPEATGQSTKTTFLLRDFAPVPQT